MILNTYECKSTTPSVGTKMLPIPAQGIEWNRDTLLCKNFFPSEIIQGMYKASLSPILDIVFQYGDVVAPLRLISLYGCKTEPRELLQIAGKMHLHRRSSKDLVHD